MSEDPKLHDYILPVLKLFGDGEEHSYKEIPIHLETKYTLLQGDRPTRARMMINNAIGYLKKALLVNKTAHQTFKITARGLEFLKRNSDSITVQDLRQFEEFNEFIQRRYKKPDKKEPDEDAGSVVPEDSIAAAYEVHKQNIAEELIEQVRQGTWQFFEMLVMDLLIAMGYGDPHDKGHLRRRPSDEGIDGIIKEDKLGLDIICIQAKKWDNPVGRPEIQKFAGSLESKHAKKGVFITTSTFTSEAKEYVQKIEKKIVLIDGERLSALMIDYNIGVDTLKTYKLKQVNTDYFVTT